MSIPEQNPHSVDTLLELYRELTDKEKLKWITVDYRKLEQILKNKSGRIKNLEAKVAKLEKRIKEEDMLYPKTLSGTATISVRPYFKLMDKYRELDKRFWEVVQERDRLKKTDCEKL
jgi:uncharacterized protein YdcH (DUF465 family)